MASTSASSVQKSFKYDVFLSFSGLDTRKSFVDNLYHALKQRSIYTYRDDEEIKKGERISDELIRAIEDSRFYVIVFSKNYASSSWCLDELVKIMDCQWTNVHTAYPVFFDVEPTEVRNQSGAVEEAFAKHKDKEAAGRWRYAMKEAADLAGWELKNTFDGHEAKLIRKIVEVISLRLQFVNSSIDRKLVGMETRVKNVMLSLETDVEDFRMIGIKGMGGAGKTTLARVVFDLISIQFDGSSFVENVRENSEIQCGGLRSLQKQLLSDVLNDPHISVRGVSDLERMMCRRKVLVVLDDVDHINQLQALAGEPKWFKSGSRIIITTREEQVLVAHGAPKNLILDVSLLSKEEALCLFSKYAFGREIPNQGYESLSGQVVRYASGLPLTLKVLGSLLRGKDELVWTDALKRLKSIPLKETLDLLELSYNSLEEEHKEIFLDVVCMLKRWTKEKAIIALESRGFYAKIGLEVLQDKSLITLSSDGSLVMHDHIEEMGKNIVRRLHPNEPYKHSRLWIEKETEEILVEGKGTDITKCIRVEMDDPLIVMKGLRKMKELRFLEVYIANISVSVYTGYHLLQDPRDAAVGEGSLYLPDSLQYLFWHGYPFGCLPEEFQANNLVSLEMRYSNMDQLWKMREKKVLKKLRFITLYKCKLRSLDIELIPNLERLHLENCDYLVELHTGAKIFPLSYLALDGSQLSSLDLQQAQNLETLGVNSNCLTKVHLPRNSPSLLTIKIDCSKFSELHMPKKCYKLESINIGRSKLTNLDLSGARNLRRLDLKKCEDLGELHMPVESHELESINIRCSKLTNLDLSGARKLKKLDLQTCDHIVELHMPVESHELESINIGCSKLRTLDLRGAQNLKRLDLKKCEDLATLQMPIESHELQSITIDYSNLKILNLTRARKLKMLDLIKCEDLEELHMPIESHELESIIIGCSKLKTLNLKRAHNLKRLVLKKCEYLVKLDMAIKSHELESINIDCSMLRTLNLMGTLNLTGLERSDDEKCENLVEFHMPIESPKLKTINICCSKLQTNYLGLSPYPLDLQDCFNLVTIHPPIGYLSGCGQGFPMVCSLAELHLIARTFGICSLHPDSNCPKFQFEGIYTEPLPSSAGNLQKLISFSRLCGCTSLGSLSEIICSLQCLRKLTLEGSIPEVPKELDQLECLEELTLLNTNIEHLPSNICALIHLKSLQIESCQFLKLLPEDLGRLECLEELHLKDCNSLLNIPNSICEMTRLKCFHLIRCIRVEKLPREIGRLPCLKDTIIEGTGII